MTSLIRLALKPSSGVHRHRRNQWNFNGTISFEIFPDSVINFHQSATSSFCYVQVFYCTNIFSDAFNLINRFLWQKFFRFHADQPAALADTNHLKPCARLSGLHTTQISFNYISTMIMSGDSSGLLYFQKFLQKTDSIKLALQRSQNQ